MTTIDAPSSFRSSSTSSATSGAPGTSRAPQNAARPKPSPPAAPAPGRSRQGPPSRSRSTTSAKRSRARASVGKLLVGRSLLPSETSGAVRAEQRRVDVRSQCDRSAEHRATLHLHELARVTLDPMAEGDDRSGPTVHGRAPAEADDQLVVAGGPRREQELADAERASHSPDRARTRTAARAHRPGRTRSARAHPEARARPPSPRGRARPAPRPGAASPARRRPRPRRSGRRRRPTSARARARRRVERSASLARSRRRRLRPRACRRTSRARRRSSSGARNRLRPRRRARPSRRRAPRPRRARTGRPRSRARRRRRPRRARALRSPSSSAARARLERDAPPRVHPEARRVERALRVEAAVDERVHELEVALRLHRAAHHAERAPQLAVAEQEPGDDRVERPPPRRSRFGCPGSDEKPHARFWSTIPVSPASTPEPQW